MRSVLKSDHVRADIWELTEKIQQQIWQGNYPHDLERLLAALQAVSEGRFDEVGGQFPSTVFAADRIPEGCRVVEDVLWSNFDIKSVKPCVFLIHRETSIGGDEMRRRAVRDHCNLGLLDLKRMFAEQDKIPAKFRDFETLFPGTVVMDSNKVLKIPYLKFFPQHWDLTQGELREEYWDILWVAKSEKCGALQRFAGRGE